MLFQRDQADAAEPLAMFWSVPALSQWCLPAQRTDFSLLDKRYDPQVQGDFWANLPLDHYFDNITDTWASMRSSWTDSTSLYAAIKAGVGIGHQTHNDLDAGDFVLEALGQRWAGELVRLLHGYLHHL
jgi:hypothetical protein